MADAQLECGAFGPCDRVSVSNPVDGDRYLQHEQDKALAALAYLPDESHAKYSKTRADVDAAIAREAEWNGTA